MEPLECRHLLAGAPLSAGAEFRVNVQTGGSQELFAESPHAVAADAAGNLVVAWSSSGQDGNGWGVYARRFAADGTPRSGEFRVNQTTANNQWYADVACDDAGGFVVTWTSDLQDGSMSGVYARRFDTSGAAAGNEFRVNTTTTGEQRHSAVAVDADGDFVVTWAGYGQSGGAGWDVYAQRYTAAGAKAGAEFRVNNTAAGDQQYAAVAAADGGAFVVTWTSGGQDGSGTGVFARRFSAAGTAAGNEFRVNTTTAGDQDFPRVASDAAGNFAVTWASNGQDGSARGVYAQRYNAAGAKLGGEFRVNQATTGDQFAATVASDAAGHFLVAWTTPNQDGSQFGVYARAYGADGSARGNEFRVNGFTAGNQVYPSVAADRAGGFAVVWESDGQDGSFFGIYGQRYAPPDTTPPTADVVDVSPDPRSTPVAQVTIRFSEPVTGFNLPDLALSRDGGANLLTAAQSLASADGGLTWVLNNLSGLTAAAGTYVLTLRANGSGVVDAAGNALATDARDQWQVLPTAAVVARHVFYNDSAFDGHDPAPGPADDAAISPDKTPLLPGAAATFANYTSFSRGVNGVMLDVAHLAGVDLRAADFICRVGNVVDVTRWAAAPVSPTVSVRAGAGVGGSDRITLVWPDGAIVGAWLQITLLPGLRTGLVAPDVCYVGNLPGETGDDPAAAQVNAADLRAARDALVAGGDAPLTSPVDFDRNGVVDVRDVVVARSSVARPALALLTPPADGLIGSPVPASLFARPDRSEARDFFG